MGKIRFLKMHGLGNDFVVIDGRYVHVKIDAAATRVLADRRTGIGCDQLIVLEPPRRATAHIMMRIRNPDGSEAEACGNATRCVAELVKRETDDPKMRIETIAGLLEAEAMADGRIAVDMGPVRTGWREIPLSHAAETEHVELSLGPLSTPVCTNVGNPHATFFVDDFETIDLARLGPVLERHALFPQRANIGVAAVRNRESIRLRVWERRDNSRVRQRRLRGIGCRASEGAYGAAFRCRARRRNARHRLAGGRARDHDRTGGAEL